MEQNKITPTPWEIQTRFLIGNPDKVFINGHSNVCELRIGNRSMSEGNADAEAIVSAINNTYGAGINPEAVPELIKAAIALLAYEQKEGLFDDYVNNGDGYSPTLEVSGTLRIILNAIKSTIEKAKL